MGSKKMAWITNAFQLIWYMFIEYIQAEKGIKKIRKGHKYAIVSFGDSQPNELDVTLLNSETRDSKQGKHLPKNSKQSRQSHESKRRFNQENPWDSNIQPWEAESWGKKMSLPWSSPSSSSPSSSPSSMFESVGLRLHLQLFQFNESIPNAWGPQSGGVQQWICKPLKSCYHSVVF